MFLPILLCQAPLSTKTKLSSRMLNDIKNILLRHFRTTTYRWPFHTSGLSQRHCRYRENLGDSRKLRRVKPRCWVLGYNATLIHSRGFMSNAMSNIHPIILSPLIFSGLLCSLWAYKVYSPCSSEWHCVNILVVYSVLWWWFFRIKLYTCLEFPLGQGVKGLRITHLAVVVWSGKRWKYQQRMVWCWVG